MVKVELFTAAQLAERDTKPKGKSGRRRSEERTRAIEQFKMILQDAAPGSGGDVLLEGDDKRIVRQNLRTAADDLHKAIEFRPIKDKTRIHFRIITEEQRAAKPKRSGRPRKTPPA